MQEQVSEFMENYHLNSNETIRYMDLISEAGELGKELLKAGSYGKTPYRTTDSCKEEMGDCIFSLLALCCEMGINAQEALDSALEKYRFRFEANGEIGSGR